MIAIVARRIGERLGRDAHGRLPRAGGDLGLDPHHVARLHLLHRQGLVVEELHPEPSLFGADAWQRAVIEQWNRHAELELLYPIQQVFRNTHSFWQGRIKQAPDFAEIMRELLAERFAWFDRELAARPYLAGDRFTVADITAMCSIDFGRVVKIRLDPATQPNLVAWHKRVSERPSATA